MLQSTSPQRRCCDATHEYWCRGGQQIYVYVCSLYPYLYALSVRLHCRILFLPAELLRAYMPEAQWDSDIDGCSQLEGRRLDSLRILWPEAPFMHDTGAISSEDVFDPRNGRVRDNDDTESDDEIDSRLNDTRVKNIEDAQLVFLLPRTLAMMEPDLQSQLHVYKAYPWNSFPLPQFRQETCVTSIASVSNEVSFNINSTHQHNVSQLQDHSVISPAATKASHTIPPPPHIKSYARVLLSSDSTSRAANESKSESSKCTCYDLMWFLLTSACLSKGSIYLSRILLLPFSSSLFIPLFRWTRQTDTT